MLAEVGSFNSPNFSQNRPGEFRTNFSKKHKTVEPIFDQKTLKLVDKFESNDEKTNIF
jgi:hypothetical protein